LKTQWQCKVLETNTHRNRLPAYPPSRRLTQSSFLHIHEAEYVPPWTSFSWRSYSLGYSRPSSSPSLCPSSTCPPPRPLPGKWLQVSDDLNHRKLAAGKFGDIFHLRLENLLVSNGTIKIADFGLARQVSSNPPYTDCLHQMVSSQLKCARFRCIVCT
jgi:hypothetical protein